MIIIITTKNILSDDGLARANQSAFMIILRSIAAGAFIALAGAFSLMVLSSGLPSIVAGLAFSLGLILVVVGKTELFTGSNLTVGLACMDGQIGVGKMLRQWLLCYLGNLIGALLVCFFVVGASPALSFLTKAAAVAMAKASLPAVVAYSRGVLCNILVCMAVFMAAQAKDVTGKVLACVFPITAFITLGYEHSIANMFLLPLGWIAGAPITITMILHNLLWVTLGNVFGGFFMVAGIYWTIVKVKSKSGTDINV